MKKVKNYEKGRIDHQALNPNSPILRKIEPAIKGNIVSIPMVGGLHHEYLRVA
jgi:hypothetical protein